MITGAHAILYSREPEADRAFLRDVLGFPHVDAGGGWLIFRLPPAELAVHPSDGASAQELYLMCDDLDATVAELAGRGVSAGAVSEERWGRRTTIRLPGATDLPLYEPHHPVAIAGG
jgi:hypothetical protein